MNVTSVGCRVRRLVRNYGSSSRRYSYRDVRDLIQWSLEDCPGFGCGVDVDGKLKRIADGIWHDNYWFWIRGRDLPGALTEQAYVLRLLDQREDWQEGPEPRERLVREAETLQVLKRSNFAHPTPTSQRPAAESLMTAIPRTGKTIQTLHLDRAVAVQYNGTRDRLVYVLYVSGRSQPQAPRVTKR